MPSLLAVDLGLRTGLALYGPDARLVWYRSQHFASRAALRRGVHGLLDACPDLDHLVLEGGGPIADIWVREARRRGISVQRIAAENWRGRFFDPTDRRGRDRSKLTADVLARRIIEWSGAPRPTSLRHDAAEAILIGLWGVLEAGWLEQLSAGILPGSGCRYSSIASPPLAVSIARSLLGSKSSGRVRTAPSAETTRAPPSRLPSPRPDPSLIR
jgi:hypothetical protein